MKFFVLAAATLLSALAAQPDFDKAKVIGGTSAPIMIEVYSSFACSHCKDFHEQVLPQIVRDYVLAGKVCVVHHETFPPNYPPAAEAAQDATAAARIGTYQLVADALFRAQATWMSNGKVWDTVASVLTPAEQKQVQALSNDAGVKSEIAHDMDLARILKIDNTPTLMITAGSRRYPYVGVPEYSLFRSLLDGLLK
jgi:protein-disulfide isomerase